MLSLILQLSLFYMLFRDGTNALDYQFRNLPLLGQEYGQRSLNIY